MRAPTILKVSVVFSVLISACGGSGASSETVALKPKITISSTTDPTSELIAEIYGQALEKAEFRVARKQAFATSAELMTALTKGEVQLTGMTSQGLLRLVSGPGGTDTPVPNTTTLQAAAIAKALPSNLVMGAPTTAEDKDVVFCAKTFTDVNTIATLTDLGAKPGIATLAAPDGFETSTPLGGKALSDTYKIDFKTVVATVVAKTLDAVNAGTADCGVGRSGDPALSAATIVVLQDDKALVPNDVILPLVTTAAGTADVLSTLDTVSAKLTTEALRTLMSRLTVDGATPEVVANEFTGNAGT
ncbi:MAG: glycine betaine ABC transporter substrate-binding protein [Ilumatobacteraceae bacterium]